MSDPVASPVASSPPHASQTQTAVISQQSNDVNQDEAIHAQSDAITKEIADSISLVGDKESIAALEDDFKSDPIYLAKAKALSTHYAFLRRTRPDGNCYYRALGYRYFERLLTDDVEWERFMQSIKPSKDAMVALGFPAFTVEDFYDNFVDAVATLKDSGPDDLHNLFNDQGRSDYTVVFLRLLTSKQLQTDADFYVHFIEDGRDVVSFCQSDVEPMYKDVDHIHIIALAAAIGVKVRILYLDRGGNKEASPHDFPEDGGEPLVHLLYRPGHYDVLYPRQQQ